MDKSIIVSIQFYVIYQDLYCSDYLLQMTVSGKNYIAFVIMQIIRGGGEEGGALSQTY